MAAKKSASQPLSKTPSKGSRGSRASSKTAKPSAKTGSTRSGGGSLADYNKKRDFTKTTEPAGVPATRRRGKSLQFIIQKHDATRLHYDLRLELDGVMKSWAVPKGPSANPANKRLAMHVEDHPVSYNTFEGTIPEGEYGGGTVMLWDTGTYVPDTSANPAAAKGKSDEDIAREAYERGDFKVVFSGKRMQGSYVLVRTRGFGGKSPKESWLLIKHRDEFARDADEEDVTEEFTTSVTTGRTMKEIAETG